MESEKFIVPGTPLPRCWAVAEPPTADPSLITYNPTGIFAFVPDDRGRSGDMHGHEKPIYILAFKTEDGTVVYRHDVVNTWTSVLVRTLVSHSVVHTTRKNYPQPTAESQRIIEQSQMDCEKWRVIFHEINYSILAIIGFEQEGLLPLRWKTKGLFDKHNIENYPNRLTAGSRPALLTTAFLDLCADTNLREEADRYPQGLSRLFEEDGEVGEKDICSRLRGPMVDDEVIRKLKLLSASIDWGNRSKVQNPDHVRQTLDLLKEIRETVDHLLGLYCFSLLVRIGYFVYLAIVR
ncbi:hypothetical protein I203_104571 [Kwoniella mangroviensis CBS 8507]|uniref:uncharacterized protein n=1 Tax=Kwoniella mangroviensis CBS 8507 TaxID=1296122 RepID=UPI00080D30F2|nr:uncharacterized protein I203_00484 [Kwoniella mangroviensis CBS 8507]OCF70350.1 hypothetical protein I203_00484 [Kwoniella mangroviensis CBS 8507]